MGSIAAAEQDKPGILIYRAQYEIIDEKQPIKPLTAEGHRRFREDVTALGMVVTGPISDPPVIHSIGAALWLELEAPVRDAAQLLGAGK